MLWLLTVVTTAVLLVIVWMVRDISRTPAAAGSVALATAASTPRSATPSASPRPKPSPRDSGTGPEIADPSAGLSYRLLTHPWRRGCPSALESGTFSWSAGESAVAGRVSVGGSGSDWYGNACSGRLRQQFQYAGPADLEPTAMNLAGALDAAYYSGLRHYRTVEDSSAMRVGGHQAWLVRFLMIYPDAASQDLAWTSEAGAVVVVDRGAGQAPAIFYVSVPSNLGVSSVSLLISSLRLS